MGGIRPRHRAGRPVPSATVPGQAPARAVVLDEWPLVRVGVAKVLGDAGMRVVAEPADGVSAVAALRAHRPDVLVVGRVDVGPADLIERALVLVPELKCVALVAGAGPAELRPVLAAGAHGVVSRAVDPEELLDVLHRVLGGDRVVSPVLLPRMFDGCLLYTSPSPRDRTRSRMPSSA